METSNQSQCGFTETKFQSDAQKYLRHRVILCMSMCCTVLTFTGVGYLADKLKGKVLEQNNQSLRTREYV